MQYNINAMERNSSLPPIKLENILLFTVIPTVIPSDIESVGK